MRWQAEQVLALAPRPSAIAAARPLAVATRWQSTGCDDRAVWGRCRGSGAEPYDCVVDHVAVASRCTCPSRQHPCKHALALLLLWVQGAVPDSDQRPGHAAAWLARAAAAPAAPAAAEVPDAGPSPAAPAEFSAASPPPPPPPPDASNRDGRDERFARMAAGLADLDRWLDDRVRTGLADPALSQYATWDLVAARLTDAQVGGLANRVRRLAGVVGSHPQWHQQVLAELGLLHLLAEAGRSLGSLSSLDGGLADSVAAAVGWQVRHADVLAGVPITDHWSVMARSEVREDRIEVRRTWLHGADTGRWAMVLAFAAYGQTFDESLVVGDVVHADVYPYPGALGLRVLMGRLHGEATTGDAAAAAAGAVATTVQQACAQVGQAVAREPWIERFPVCVRAHPARERGAWAVSDDTGSLPLADTAGSGLAMLLACSAGAPVVLTGEWTPWGVVPLSVHLPDRTVDIGPRAEPSFLAGPAARGAR